MKKFFCGIVKFLAVLAVLGAVVYAVVAYWDKIMELVCKVKGLISGKCDDCMEDVEFADWEEKDLKKAPLPGAAALFYA